MPLIKRNNTYHFRFRVPNLVVNIVGRGELRASLRTRSKRIANTVDSRLTRRCRLIFTRLQLLPETVLMELDSNLLNQIIRDYITETINSHVTGHAAGDFKLRDTLDSLDNMIGQVKHFIQEGGHHLIMGEAIERIIAKYGLKLDMDKEGKVLAFHLCKADIRAMEQAIAYCIR